MIKIPPCYYCKNYIENGNCLAYPNGIPKDYMYARKKDNQECNNNIKFVKHDDLL